MRPLRHLPLGLLALLCGCPNPGPELPPLKPAEADAFSALGQRISTEDGLRQELKDLQARWTQTPDPAGLSPGDAQERFHLSGFTRDQLCGLVLENAETGERWELQAWDGSGLKTGPVKVQADESTPGGYRFVGSTGEGGGLLVTLNARWVQGRFLQITREIEIAGGDVTLRLPFGSTLWTLAGPPQSLRLLPGDRGPYGEVPAAETDGSWHEQSYPWELALPAIAAYSVTGGMLLSPVDEHQRMLTRSYRVGYRVGPEDGPLARVGLEQYDSTADMYGQAYLVSGLTLRESVVAAPLSFHGGTDFRLTLAAIDELADLCHGFIMAPAEADASNGGQSGQPKLAKTCILEPEDWNKWLANPPGGVKALLGWRQVAALIRTDSLDDIQSQLPDETPLTPEAEGTALNGTAASQLRLVSPFLAKAGSQVSRLQGGALLTKAGSSKASEAWLELREADVAAWVARSLAGAGSRGMGALTGVADWWREPLPPPQPGQFAGSWTAAACILELTQAAQSDESLPVMAGLPRACRPAYASAIVLDAPPPLPGGFDSSRRCQAYLVWRLCGKDAYVGRGAEDLATLLRLSGAGASGVVLNEKVMAFGGADAFCKQLDELANRVGEFDLHLPTTPPPGADAGTKACFMFPADPGGESTLWIGFAGLDGSVTVDEHNLMTVQYGADSFSLTLPPGYWKPLHPDPLQVKAGDVVVVSKSFVAAPDTNPSSNDTI